MKKLNFSILFFIIFLLSWPAQSALCKKWGEAVEVGKVLDASLKEQSGMAFSPRYSRLYYINDSGALPEMFISDLKGKSLGKTRYFNKMPLDTEDIAYGKCDSKSEQHCIYIGDIGDNLGLRPFVHFFVLEEAHDWKEKTSPVRSIIAKYTDGPHDAEAFAVHPSGDLFLITKNYEKKKARVAGVYRIGANDVFKGGMQTFLKIGEIDVPEIFGSDKKSNVITAMSISPDGKKFLAINYNEAIEFNIDLTKKAIPKKLTRGIDYQLIKIKKLSQMESVSYAEDDKSFFYSSEGTESPLMKVNCISK